MTPPFPNVAIVGVGLLGASLGLALKARGLAGQVMGIGRRESSLAVALDRGAIDQYATDLAAAVAADLVVVATPAAKVIDQLDALRPRLRPDTVVTDVASTKAAICAHARKTWTAPRRFVGSHPMAGSEKFGPEHGDAKLYEDSVCLMEAGPGVAPEARAQVRALWSGVGARVVDIEPRVHDALLARTSHLPHVLAAAIATLSARSGNVRDVVGNGFRDTTRIAAGRPEVWRDISLTNREALLDAVEEMQLYLKTFHEALARNDGEALEQFFEDGRAAREEALGE